MAILSDYTTGTVTIAANATAVTGIGTAWNLTALQKGDELLINNLVAIIDSVNSATSITLTRPWTGGAVTSVAYRARYQPDGSRFSNISKELLELLNNSPNFDAFAALVGANGLVPYFTGAGTMSTIASGDKGRDLLTSTTTLNMLGKFGPVNGGTPSPVPSGADVGLTDGDFNTITVPGTYAITGNWVNGYNGAASSSYTGMLTVYGRFSQRFQEFWASNAATPIRWTRYSATGDAGTWANPWWDTTPLNFGSSAEINNANLPTRLRSATTAITDANLGTENGFYSLQSTAVNIPETGYGVMFVAAAGPTAITQIWTRTSNGSAYIRWNNGTWSSWAKIGLQDRSNVWAGSATLDAAGSYVTLLVRRNDVSVNVECGTTFGSVGTQSDHPITFKANNVERMRVEPTNGDLLIGLTATIDPAVGSTTGFAIRGATGRAWRRASGYNPFIQTRLASDGIVQEFYRENTQVGNIAVSATTTTYATSSDYRLKYDVEPIVTFTLNDEDFEFLPDALRRVMLLRPVHYRWKNAPEKGLVTGFIAHEVQSIFPHAVTGEKDGTKAIGREILPAREEKRTVIEIVRETDEDGNETETEIEVEKTFIIPEVINENVREDGVQEGATFEKTGEIEVYQAMDYGLITADLTAALQDATLLILEQQKSIAALEARIAALEGN